MSLLAGKLGIVFGVANKRSIAWAIAQAWHKAGAKLAFTYQGERLKENVEELAGTFGADIPLMECDVTRDNHIARVFDEVGKNCNAAAHNAGPVKLPTPIAASWMPPCSPFASLTSIE